MKKTGSFLGVASIAVIGLLAACGGQQASSTQPSKYQQAYAQFEKHLDKCSATHETDPRTAAVGENELAPREREWRTCAYDGIRTLLVPGSADPELYATLIAEDQAMTEKVANGQMTRSERRARLDEIRDNITAKEARSAELSEADAEHNAALVRQVRGLP